MRIISKNFIEEEIKNVGFDESWLKAGVLKHKFLNLKINELRAIEANILKQTALSSNCDCAVHKRTIDCKIEKTDCILSGTITQLKEVSKKLKRQPLNLPKIADEISEQIKISYKNKKTSKIVGILNLTENSFSDGGEFIEFKEACNKADELIAQGAHIIDIGAESTQPNSKAQNINTEIQRILPVLKYIKEKHPKILVSIDTRNSETAKEALKLGADIINDVSGLRYDNNMANTVAEFKKAKIVITHSRSTPDDMQNHCNYQNLIDEIFCELNESIKKALGNEIEPQNIIIDPGFGFAKNNEQNLELLVRISEFKSLGYPILVGVSRKRFLQNIANTQFPKEADNITSLTSFYFSKKRIDYIRVHDVKKTAEAINFGSLLQ